MGQPPNYIYSTGSFHNTTVLNELENEPMTGKELCDQLGVKHIEYSMSNKLGQLAKLGFSEPESTPKKGMNRRYGAKYKITEAGLKFLEENRQYVQALPVEMLLTKPSNSAKKAAKQKALFEPEPVFSPAATAVMDTIAPILDANQKLYETMATMQLALVSENFNEVMPIPKKESGLMESISLIQIDNAKVTNQLVKIKKQLSNIMEKHNESGKKGDNKQG